MLVDDRKPDSLDFCVQPIITIPFLLHSHLNPCNFQRRPIDSRYSYGVAPTMNFSAITSSHFDERPTRMRLVNDVGDNRPTTANRTCVRPFFQLSPNQPIWPILKPGSHEATLVVHKGDKTYKLVVAPDFALPRSFRTLDEPQCHPLSHPWANKMNEDGAM